MAAEKNVTQALAAVMAEVRGVGKDGFHDAPGAKFKFRGIDAIVNAVGPAMRNHGVIVTPQLVDVTRRDVSTSGGKASRETCVIVKYIFTGPDGSKLETIVPGEAMDGADKGTAKAMSVAFRIALLQALCLPTDDADPDSHHYEREAPPRQAAPPQQRSNAAGAGAGEAARADLRAKVKAANIDGKALADKFLKQYGEELSTCTDAVRIQAFAKLQNLSADSRVNGRGAPAEAGTR